jgi:hypothetical protein
MPRHLWLVTCFACNRGELAGVDVEGAPEPTDAEVPPTEDTGARDTGQPSHSSPGPCEADPSLSVISAVPNDGLISTFVEVAVSLSSPASVAVQCTSDAEPTEIFFAEDTTAATEHAVRISGLVPSTAYNCSAVAVCPSTGGPATRFVWQTGPPPADVLPLSIAVDPLFGMDGAWTLAPYTIDATGGDTWFVAWGPDGTARWWFPAPAGVGMWVELLWHPAEGEFVWGGGMDPQGRVRILAPWVGETYAFAPVGWQDIVFHHDGKRAADGRLLTLESRLNHGGGVGFTGFGVRLHDPTTGTVDFDYDSQRLVDDGVFPPPAGGFDPDPWHANWADWEETPTGPELYVSLCFAHQILAIDGYTGSLLWQLGRGKGWTVLDAVGLPLSEDQLPQCQHGLDVVGNTFLVYDNGQDRPRSSASEWNIDPLARTAQRTWYWTEPGWKEDFLGDIDYLPNNRILVTEASQTGVSDIVEVDRATGLVASRASLAAGGFTYRAQRYDGCELFTSVAACDAIAARYSALADLLLR